MRFNTDRALFDAFPTARDHIKAEPADVPPAVFATDLVKRGKSEDAIAFCAYLLARREAVAWGCRCMRGVLGSGTPSPGLLAAETWVGAPSENARVAAYERWNDGDREDPSTWLALAAVWSGGSLVPTLPNAMPAPPYLTANMVRVALVLALNRRPLQAKAGDAQDWVRAGLRLAETGL